MVQEKIKEIKITQIKSAIGSPKLQKLTVEALGIKKLNQSKVHKATPQILGMVKKVRHLVKVEEL
jgi:large subunit ribosomal protein L30